MSNEIKVVLSDVNKIVVKVNWLSSNDYTTAEKNKVANVPNDTNASLSNKVDKVTDKSLVSDSVITELTDGNETTLHKHNANNTPFTPTGNLSSINVQNALGELDAKKANQVDFDKVAQPGKNLFDASKITSGVYLNGDNGNTFVLAGYFVSDFIKVNPSQSYYCTGLSSYRRVVYYTIDKAYISKTEASNLLTTPSNCEYIKYSSANSDLVNMQIEIGSEFTGFESFGSKMQLDFMSRSGVPQKRLYTFNDAWVAWLNGEKFPIAITGDSTVDGTRTTGVVETLTYGIVDNQNPNAFPKLLETHLRNATGNAILRIYNAGHAGKRLRDGLTNINAEFGSTSVYADTKMVGVGYGINDRTLYSTQKAFRNGFKADCKFYIEWLYNNGKQPFIITTQAIAEAGVKTSEIGTYPLRTSEAVNSIANEVKRELAKEYNLEIIDVHEYTHKFMKYSQWSIYEIMSDYIHFGNVGHKYEGGMMFAHLSPRTVFVKGTDQLDFSSQQVVTTIPSDKITLPYPLTDSFKAFANYVKADSLDTKIMDFWVFNDAQRKLTFKAHKSDLTSLTYVKVDGVNKALTGLETNIGLYDIGLYHLEVFSGASTKVDFKGFIFE